MWHWSQLKKRKSVSMLARANWSMAWVFLGRIIYIRAFSDFQPQCLLYQRGQHPAKLKCWKAALHLTARLLSQKMLKKKPLIHLQWLPGTRANPTNHAAGQTVLSKAAIRSVGCFLAFWVKNRLGNGKAYSMLSEVAFWLISFWIQLSPWSLSFF